MASYYYIELAGSPERATREAAAAFEALIECARERWPSAADPLRHILRDMLRPRIVATAEDGYIWEYGGRLYGNIVSPQEFEHLHEWFSNGWEQRYLFEDGKLWVGDVEGPRIGYFRVIAIAAGLEQIREYPEGWHDPQIEGLIFLRFRHVNGLPGGTRRPPPDTPGLLRRTLGRLLRRK